MSNTTVFVLCVAVPLLLGGFVNFYANKPWILYLPLLGLLLALGYGGHLAIQSFAYPNKSDNSTTPRLESATPTPTPTTPMKNDRPNQSISTVGQSGGQNIIAGGDVHLGPRQRALTADQSSSIARVLAAAPKGKLRIMAINDDGETLTFAKEIHRNLAAAGYDVGDNVTSMVRGGDPFPPVAFAVPGRKTDEFTSPLFEALRQLDPNPLLLATTPSEPPTIMISRSP